jgi:hypothetical protein
MDQTNPPAGNDAIAAGASRQEINVSFDVGRTLGIVVFGSLLIVGAIVLWLNDKDAGATALLALGEAVIFGGLGVAAGEKNGLESQGTD